MNTPAHSKVLKHPRTYLLLSLPLLVTSGCEDSPGGGGDTDGLTGVTDGPGGGTDPTGGSGGTSGSGSTGGSDSGTGGSATTGGTSTAGEPTGPPPPGDAARGIRVTDIMINQGIQSELVLDGQFVDPGDRTTVIIGGRKGMIQAFWELDSDFAPREIEARLTIYDSGGGALKEYIHSQTISGPSGVVGSADGSFGWILDGPEFPGDGGFSVAFYEVGADGSGPDSGYRFPVEGIQAIEPDASDLVWDMVFLVSGQCSTPLVFDDDLKGHLRQLAYNNFPVSTLNIEFRDTPEGDVDCSPTTYSGVRQVRDRDAFGPAYFYTAVIAASQWGNSQGGVTPGYDPFSMNADRVCAAGGHSNGDFGTAPHEQGHMFQRYHPWEDGRYDSSPYPYPEPYSLPVPGFQLEPGRMMAPRGVHGEGLNTFKTSEWRDMMGYDFPKWVTPYTFNEILPMMEAVQAWSRGGPDGEKAYREYFEGRSLKGSLEPDGHWSWSIGWGGEVEEATDGNYAELRAADTDGLPLKLAARAEYAWVDPGNGERERRELRGAIVPLPSDYEARGLSDLRMVVEGDVHEVSMDFVRDELPQNIDWREKLDEHLARREAALNNKK